MILPSAQPPQDAGSNSPYTYSATSSSVFPRSDSGSTHNPTTKHASTAKPRGEHSADHHVPNIVIYGETGVGKSSIINLIAGHKLADTSNDTLGCMFQHKRYIASLDGMSCAIWDTTGLEERTEGTVPAKLAENNLRTLMQGLAHSEGTHLIIYCVHGTRLTKALKRNYDLFYVTVFRKKVPVALVVTGLEHQPGEMDTWWNENETVLRRHGMRFDAHVCATTLDVVDDHVIRQRRSDSQKRLRELVVRYSRLPAWKTDSSFISRVLPVFRTVLRKTSPTGKSGNYTSMRKVIVCDMVPANNISIPTLIKHSPHIPMRTHTERVQIEGRSYDFFHVNKHALQIRTFQAQHAGPMDVGSDAGVLVFYTSPLGDTVIPPREVDMLEVFYEIAGGQTCPMIVVLRGCDDEERAIRECRNVLALRHNIQAYITTFSDQKLAEMIEGLCIEHTEVKTPRAYRTYATIRHCIMAAVETVIPAHYVPSRRRRGKAIPGPTIYSSNPSLLSTASHIVVRPPYNGVDVWRHPCHSRFSDSRVSGAPITLLQVGPVDLPDLTKILKQGKRRIIGHGSFGTVYRCRYARNEEVAVKAISFPRSIRQTEKDAFLRKMKRELGIWKRLDHPNIVKLLGTASGDDFGSDYLCMVSMWMPHGTLFEYVSQGETMLSLPGLIRLIARSAAGLEYLHSKFVVHGDLHPGNIMIDMDHNPRLTDFGFSQTIDPQKDLTYLWTNSVRPGAVMWVAPELLYPELFPDAVVDAKVEATLHSDIYSFGSIMLFILSGKLPWSKADFENKSDALQNPPRPLSPVIPDGVWDFIERCWSPRVPGNRPLAQEVLSFARDRLQPLLQPKYEYIVAS